MEVREMMSINNQTILVVDDEPHMCNALRRILETEGYKVKTAYDGTKALKLAKKEKPDLILLDIMMPGINGREVCREVRKISAATQIVYCTAKAEPIISPQRLRELRNEADAFIAKPATSKQIVSNVRKVLRKVQK